MAETRPHIAVSHHDRYGVVAAASHDNHVADHMLRRVGFERLPGSNLGGRAFDVFYAMPGKERPDPRLSMMQRAQAATAVSPARRRRAAAATGRSRRIPRRVSSRRIRVEHGIAHLKNRRAQARHLGHHEHMGDLIQAVAGLQ
ncbi:hypothetical protein [Streptomyces tubercidicus]|uniref:hypothetical protein n=1 Tax=Streptomyces tubercidicus TaxID=47759 RepID=UPI002E15A570|nr:hypothetical protein OG761_02800 [Streptomyces tubercidicus]